MNSRNSTIINLESPYSSQDPKKEVECARAHVHWRPHCFVEATYHIGLCSRNKFEHNQFSRSQDIEARYARAYVHSDTPWPWACWSHITNWPLATCQISVQSVQPFPKYISGVCTCARAIVTTSLMCGSHLTNWPPGLEKWFQRWRGLGLGGPRGKRSPSVSKGPNPPIQLLQLLKNSPREVRGADFHYILGPLWSPPRKWN